MMAASPRTPLPTTDILGVNVGAINMDMAVETVERWIQDGEQHYVIVCNVHLIMEAQDDPAFRDLLNGAGMITPDGMPLVWLQKRGPYRDQVSRVCGFDLMESFLERSQTTGHRHFFYGGAPGVAETVAARFAERFPDARIAGFHTPGKLAIGEMESDAVIDSINGTNPDIVWVGLGAPKQERWMRDHMTLLSASGIFGVGAAFDFHANTTQRAPLWMQRSGLEWAFRISQDPKRLAQRYATTNGAFALGLLKNVYVRR